MDRLRCRPHLVEFVEGVMVIEELEFIPLAKIKKLHQVKNLQRKRKADAHHGAEVNVLNHRDARGMVPA